MNLDNGVNGLLENRRGYQGYNNAGVLDPILDNSMLTLDGASPTFFANPFRSSDSGSLVPLNSMQRPGSECTMMRRMAMNPGPDGQWGNRNNDDMSRDGRPENSIVDDLVEYMANGSDDVEDPTPLFGSRSDEEFNDGARHAAFGFQPMTRLSSMTTQRSNVYAVWITIGFFEVQPAPSRVDFLAANDPQGALTDQQRIALYDRVYPEGYQFGKEAGADTGNIVRVREFAMIDRSIPVAFEPGKNHNTEKAIRLRRRLD